MDVQLNAVIATRPKSWRPGPRAELLIQLWSRSKREKYNRTMQLNCTLVHPDEAPKWTPDFGHMPKCETRSLRASSLASRTSREVRVVSRRKTTWDRDDENVMSAAGERA